MQKATLVWRACVILVLNYNYLVWKIPKVAFLWFIAGSLESAYSSIWGSHKIWGQDLGIFMISRPILHGSDWCKFSIWNSVTSFYNITRQQCGCNVHDVIFHLILCYTRQYSSRMHSACFGGHHEMSVPVGVGPQVNKFEQASSDVHQGCRVSQRGVGGRL